MAVITNINQLDFNKRYSYSDYLEWNFKERIELIKGRLFKMSPSPNLYHQKVSAVVFNALFNYLENDECQVFVAPLDVRLTSNGSSDNDIDTVVQPDIFVVCDPSKLDKRGCKGAPDLIVEILSLSTGKKDLNEKKRLYEENGVKEYWVIHPSDGTLVQFELISHKYEHIGIFASGEMVYSKTIEGFQLDLGCVFTGISD